MRIKNIVSVILASAMVMATLSGCGGSSNTTSLSTTMTGTSKADNTTVAMPASTTVASSQTSGGNSSDKQLHIVYVTPLIASDVWLVSKDGFDAAAKELNFQGDWVGPTNIDVDSMIKQIEIAIAEKADGIITCGLNPEAMVGVMKQADEAGIPVILVNAGSKMEAPYFAYIGTDGEVLGSLAAEQVVKALNGKAPHTIYVGSTITNSSVIDTTNGYKSVLSKQDGYKELTLAENNDDLSKSIELWQNLFTTYPDVNVCANVSPSGAVGAAQVAKEQNLLNDKIIMSIDDTNEVLDLIREGTVYGTMVQNYYRMGYQAAEWICNYKREGKSPTQKVNDSGTLFVNKDNVDSFKDSLRDKSQWK